MNMRKQDNGIVVRHTVSHHTLRAGWSNPFQKPFDLSSLSWIEGRIFYPIFYINEGKDSMINVCIENRLITTPLVSIMIVLTNDQSQKKDILSYSIWDTPV